MIDPKRQSRRIRLGIVAGLVAGGAWAALERRPERAAAADGVQRPPVEVVGLERGADDGALPGLSLTGAADGSATASQAADATHTAGDAARWAMPAGAIDPRHATMVDWHGNHLGQVLEDGTRVVFTLDARLQNVAQSTLERYKVGWGAVVAIRPATGEILAFAEHAEGRPDLARLPLHAGAPAASVFKLVTSSALLENGGLTADSKICTHGGEHKLTLYNLKPSERLDTRCETLAEALGSSNNVAFARWADEKLEPTQLQAMANRFLFNKRLPFPWAVGVSEARIPTASRLGLARSAAGFEGTTLSPLQAALLGATIANDGVMMAPYLVQHADKNGETLFDAAPAKLADVLRPETAKTLRAMLEETITNGTGRKFFEKKGVARLPVRAGGKSGSLSGSDDGITKYYSWFVAMAPIDKPEIVVAALVVNGAEWTIKGAVPVRDVLLAYFDRAVDDKPDPADLDPLADP